jgi:hypothetical protein
MAWPALPYEEWRETKETLHRYAQMVGMLRMALVPHRNHWWNVTLSLSARGLTTGPMPYGEDGHVEVELDLVDHHARVRASDGRTAGFPLRDRLACARFHADLTEALHAVGVDAAVPAQPYDLGDSPPFPVDEAHDRYDAEAVERWWGVLRRTEHVLASFASRFTGKASPAHLFWHSFDFAHARFNGRRAPAIPGADRVTAEAYSHELIAFGWWPGDDRRTPYPAFYSYTAPEPVGLRDHPLQPSAAAWQDTGNGSLAILEYDAVRTATDPALALIEFFESAYRAGASAAGWDVAALAPR